jgi:hypothetical protein
METKLPPPIYSGEGSWTQKIPSSALVLVPEAAPMTLPAGVLRQLRRASEQRAAELATIPENASPL